MSPISQATRPSDDVAKNMAHRQCVITRVAGHKQENKARKLNSGTMALGLKTPQCTLNIMWNPVIYHEYRIGGDLGNGYH